MPQDDLHDGLPPLLNADNVANGALYELLGEALGNLAKNISDPNTSEKAKRTITIKLVADPYPDRSGFTYSLDVQTKLAGMKPAEGHTAYIARKGGEYLVVGKNHKQLEMELRAYEPERMATPSRPQ